VVESYHSGPDGCGIVTPGYGNPGAKRPGRQLTIAFDTTIAPSYLDPAEVAGLATPCTFFVRCTLA
jgi:hypothetical protein